MKAFYGLVAFGLIGFGLFALGIAYNQFADPLAIDEPAVLEVRSGQTAIGLLQVLVQRDWAVTLPPRPLIQLALKLNPQWAEVRAGHYRVYPGDSLLSVAQRIRTGEVDTFQVTVIEGTRARELLQQLAQQEGVVDDMSALSADEIMARINPEWTYLEGAFLPETYRFPWGTPLSQILQRMHQAMTTALAEAWAQCQPETCRLTSPSELLVLASIIEKETGVAAERTEISGVFHRRLRKNMRLQTDPTVIYGLGDSFDGNLTRVHLRTDTPWNTYTRAGLPPTPICLPGRDSLLAAAQPKAGSSLYFVATGKGAHVFSDTLAEHQKAVHKYQLKRRNP